MENTKERILLCALELFSKDGFEAVSVSDIAKQAGLTKGALYRHYENKRDIFNSILLRMEQNDAENAAVFDLPEQELEKDGEKYRRASLSRLAEYTKAQFRYWAEDDFARCFRRMLTVEQYRSEEMKALFSQYLSAGPVGYISDIFKSIGIENAERNAAQFFAPMFLLLSLYDSAEDKKQVPELFDSILDEKQKELERGIS